MKKLFIILLINCIVFSIVFCFSSFYEAQAADNFKFSTFEGASKNSEPFDKAAKNITGTILQAIRYAGAGIAIISLVIIGIRYMIGSAGDKADYKKNLVIYVIGGVGMFTAATLVKYIQDFASKAIVT